MKKLMGLAILFSLLSVGCISQPAIIFTPVVQNPLCGEYNCNQLNSSNNQLISQYNTVFSESYVFNRTVQYINTTVTIYTVNQIKEVNKQNVSDYFFAGAVTRKTSNGYDMVLALNQSNASIIKTLRHEFCHVYQGINNASYDEIQCYLVGKGFDLPGYDKINFRWN